MRVRDVIRYTPGMLRVVNMLVETSDSKAPSSRLGTTVDVLQGSGGRGDGHIPRNIRLQLLLTDLVEPYLVWKDVDNVSSV